VSGGAWVGSMETKELGMKGFVTEELRSEDVGYKCVGGSG